MGLLDRLFSGKLKPAGKWVQATTTVPVLGLPHREAARAFLRAAQQAEAKGQPYGVNLRRDPGNAYNGNAVAVDGHASGRLWHIGFLDRDTAEEVADDLLSNEIPISAELCNLGVGNDGDTDVTIIVLALPRNSISRSSRQFRSSEGLPRISV